MIIVNEHEIEINHFPDKTQLLRIPFKSLDDYKTHNTIFWKYECDEEMVTLYYVVKHLRNKVSNAHLLLNMPYVPNARMDRVKNNDEVFTLKYFCDFINDLKFDEVIVSDPHSNVSEALLNNVIVIKSNAGMVYDNIDKSAEQRNELFVYYPDNGAMKRYSDLRIQGKVIYGEKQRDWNTGKIIGLDIKTECGVSFEELGVPGNDVLMIDDIISYGGTMYYSALKLKELGVENIYIYCSHLENSVLDKENGTLLKLLDDGTIKKLYTDEGSIFTLKHPRIELVK